jgi:hypothetical protein
MQLGETIATYDVDLALRGETGKFEVRGPNGDLHYVTCRPNGLVAQAETSASQLYPGAFFIRKIAALVEAEKSDANLTARQDGNFMPANSPFLLETRPDIEIPSTDADYGTMTPCDSGANTEKMFRLELSYSEADGKKEHPCAFVCVQSEAMQYLRSAWPLMTAPCSSFTELDAEIRRLHAQLDEICLRAKKNFYKAYAAAASA